MIIYFSGTGNSLTIAKDLAYDLGETVLSMNEAKKLKTITDTLIGFVFPVHNYDIPPMFKAVIDELQFPSVEFSFGIITHGGDKGNALLSLKKIMKEKESDLNYQNDVLMPVNSRIMYGMLTNKIEERIGNAKIKTKIISNDIRDKVENSKVIKKKHIIAVIHTIAESSFSKKYFTPVVYPDICINCGICSSVCPVNNISIKEGKAFIENRCEQCTTCMHWCPQVAIHYKKRKVKKEQQYHHPEVELKDLIPK